MADLSRPASIPFWIWHPFAMMAMRHGAQQFTWFWQQHAEKLGFTRFWVAESS